MGIELVPLQSPYCMPFNSGGKVKVPATRLGGCQFSGPERDWWSNYPNVFQGAWKTLLGLVEANNFLDAIKVINPTLYLQSNIRGKNLRPPPAWGFDYLIWDPLCCHISCSPNSETMRTEMPLVTYGGERFLKNWVKLVSCEWLGVGVDEKRSSRGWMVANVTVI